MERGEPPPMERGEPPPVESVELILPKGRAPTRSAAEDTAVSVTPRCLPAVVMEAAGQPPRLLSLS